MSARERIFGFAQSLRRRIGILDSASGTVLAFAAVLVSERDPSLAGYYLPVAATASILVFLLMVQATHRKLLISTPYALLFFVWVLAYPFAVSETNRSEFTIIVTWLALASGFLSMIVKASGLDRVRFRCRVGQLEPGAPPVEGALVQLGSRHEFVSGVTDERGFADLSVRWPYEQELILISVGHPNCCKVPAFQLIGAGQPANWITYQSTQVIYRKGRETRYYDPYEAAMTMLKDLDKVPRERPPPRYEMVIDNLAIRGETIKVFLWLFEQPRANFAIDVPFQVLRVTPTNPITRARISVTPLADCAELASFAIKLTIPVLVHETTEVDPNYQDKLREGRPTSLNVVLRRAASSRPGQEIVQVCMYAEFKDGMSQLWVVPLLAIVD